jgi:hypothetical protein
MHVCISIFFCRIMAGAFEFLKFTFVQVPWFGLVSLCLCVRVSVLIYNWHLGYYLST